MRMDPTHQSDSWPSLFGLGMPTPLCESRITTYCGISSLSACSGAVPDYQTSRPDGIFLRSPRPACPREFSSATRTERPALTARHVLVQHGCIHQPSSFTVLPRAGTHGPLCSTFVLFRMQRRASAKFCSFVVCVRARGFPGLPDYNMPCILNVSLLSTVRVPLARLKLSASWACITSRSDNICL